MKCAPLVTVIRAFRIARLAGGTLLAFAVLCSSAVAAAPTFVTSAQTSSWTTSTTPKSFTLNSLQAGDLVVAYGETSDAGATIAISGGGLTWTERQRVNISGYAGVYIWTASTSAAGNLTVTCTRGGTTELYGCGAVVWRNATVGASNKANLSSGAPSLSITTTAANSAVLVANADWSGTSGSRTWRTGGGALTETTYELSPSAITAYGGYHADAGAAGAKVVGLTQPTGQHYSIAALEVKGHSPAAPTAAFTSSPSSPVTGSAVTFDSSNSTCAATPCTYA
jgi:hypothetical protein